MSRSTFFCVAINLLFALANAVCFVGGQNPLNLAVLVINLAAAAICYRLGDTA